MQFFEQFTRQWLSAIEHERVEFAAQLVESHYPDEFVVDALRQADDKTVQVFNFEFQDHLCADPYQVFRHVLLTYGQEFGDDLIEQKISELTYSLHTEALLNWYRGNLYFREAPLIFEEISYELDELKNGLLALLDALSELRPFLLLLKRVNSAPSAILEFLSLLLDHQHASKRWMIAAFFSQRKGVKAAQQKPIWLSCLRAYERKGAVIPLHRQSDTRQSVEWQRASALKTFDEQYMMLMMAAEMFAFADVIEISDQIRSKYSDLRSGRLRFLKAYSLLMLGDLDDAAQEFAKVQNRLQATNDQNLFTASHFWQAICFTQLSYERYARAAQEQCEKLAIESMNARWYAMSQFISFYIDDHLAPHRVNEPYLLMVIHLLKVRGYRNHQIKLLTQLNSDAMADSDQGIHSQLENCKIALRYARTIKNCYAMSQVLQTIGNLRLRLGNHTQTQRLFELSLSVLERYRSDAQLAQVLNSLGYSLVGQEDFKRAWSYHDQALQLLLKERNYTEFSLTLYNFAWLYFQSGNLQRSLDAVNDLIQLMHIRHVESAAWLNLNDLCVFKGWLHTVLNQPIQARHCELRISQDYQHLRQSTLGKVVHAMLQARLAMFELRHQVALECTERAEQLLSCAHDLDTYTRLVVQLDLGLLLRALDKTDAADQLFSALRKQTHDLKLNTLAQRVSRAVLGFSPAVELMLPPITQPYYLLFELAKRDTDITNVQRELADLQQTNRLAELSSNTTDTNRFLKRFVDVLDRRIPANDIGVLIWRLSDEPFEDIAHSNGVSAERLDDWRNRLTNANGRVMQSLDPPNEAMMAWSLKMTTAAESWLVLAGSSQQVEIWNTSLISMIAQQLGLVLDRRLRESYLEYRNKTDLLTGALNRAGIFEQLKKHFQVMKRKPEQPFSLCYFDLDHFKYFNDRFGHELGDRLLTSLVSMVNHELRGSDDLGRIGGDEFIIMMRDTDQASAYALVERLRLSIAQPQWWLKLLVNDSSQAENPIPQQEWLSASFGLVTMTSWPEVGLERIELVAHSDKAMYEAKSQGKNCIVVRNYQTST